MAFMVEADMEHNPFKFQPIVQSEREGKDMKDPTQSTSKPAWFQKQETPGKYQRWVVYKWNGASTSLAGGVDLSLITWAAGLVDMRERLDLQQSRNFGF